VAESDRLWVLVDGAALRRSEVTPVHVTGPAARLWVVTHVDVCAELNAECYVHDARRVECHSWNLVGTSWIKIEAVTIGLRYLDHSVCLSCVDASIITDDAEVTSSSSPENLINCWNDCHQVHLLQSSIVVVCDDVRRIFDVKEVDTY
jgi:hypothetical protein